MMDAISGMEPTSGVLEGKKEDSGAGGRFGHSTHRFNTKFAVDGRNGSA